METIRGKRSLEMTAAELNQRLAGYKQILLDLGTGDGRYVYHMAEQHPDRFFIGVDACRENLYVHSRKKLTNALFIIANAQALPVEFKGLASQVTINFPWGSLLESLLADDAGLMRSLQNISRSAASVDVRLNGGALAEAGTTLEDGVDQIYNNLLRSGWQLNAPVMMNASALRKFPSTWAKRLAFGRDPRAVQLNLHKP